MEATQRLFAPNARASLWVLYGPKSGALGIDRVALGDSGHHTIGRHLGRYPVQLPSLEVSAADWANLQSIAAAWGKLED